MQTLRGASVLGLVAGLLLLGGGSPAQANPPAEAPGNLESTAAFIMEMELQLMVTRDSDLAHLWRSVDTVPGYLAGEALLGDAITYDIRNLQALAEAFSIGAVPVDEELPLIVYRTSQRMSRYLAELLPVFAPAWDEGNQAKAARWLSQKTTQGTAAFRQLDALPYPLGADITIPLGDLLEAPGSARRLLMTSWRTLSTDERAALTADLLVLRNSIRDILTGNNLLPRYSELCDPWLEAEELPPPAGEGNIRWYAGWLVDLATVRQDYAALVRADRLLFGKTPDPAGDRAYWDPPGVPERPDPSLSPELATSLAGIVQPQQMREPLQLPLNLEQRPSSNWFLRWLNRLFSGPSPVWQTPASRAAQWIAILLAAFLAGWLLHLLWSPTGPWTRRTARVMDPALAVAAGRHLPMDEQFRLALAAAEAGRMAESWHWLQQGYVIGLAERQVIRLDWSRTNRELLRELQSQSALQPLSRRFFQTAEGVVFGGRASNVDEVSGWCRELSTQLTAGPAT